MKFNLKILALIFVILFGICFYGNTNAYTLDTDGYGHRLKWPTMPRSYWLVTGNVPSGGTGEQNLFNGFWVWDQASGPVAYAKAGYKSTSNMNVGNNKLNMVFFHSGWPWDSRSVAITWRFYSTSNGNLLDADMTFNSRYYKWGIGKSTSFYDIWNVASHEAGHFSGLGHSSVSSATMYPTAKTYETIKRDLYSDDINGIKALYGG